MISDSSFRPTGDTGERKRLYAPLTSEQALPRPITPGKWRSSAGGPILWVDFLAVCEFFTLWAD